MGIGLRNMDDYPLVIEHSDLKNHPSDVRVIFHGSVDALAGCGAPHIGSKERGTRKSSILVGFSMKQTIHFGVETPPFCK